MVTSVPLWSIILRTLQLDAILSLEPSSITQFPYILSAIALIVLSGLFVLWSQSVPLWSIILRTLHLIGISLWLGALSYLLISVFT